ncbi:MAG: hypothetical protein HY964_00600 [Ignavibacteriales bacterium]|nr:hypothetical protein [Ignavibacteriales bacterium]
MRKLIAFLTLVLFFSFSGVINAQEVKEKIKEVKTTEQVTKKVTKTKKIKKVKKDCAATCPDKSKCASEKKGKDKE